MGKVKSITRTMIPMDYTELNLEEWRGYIHDCVRENEILNQANQILNPEPEVRAKTTPLTPQQKAKGDIVIYIMMFVAAISLALFNYYNR